jgi:hypothetical protein
VVRSSKPAAFNASRSRSLITAGLQLQWYLFEGFQVFAAFEMFLRFEEFDDFQWFEVQSLRRSMLRVQGV